MLKNLFWPYLGPGCPDVGWYVQRTTPWRHASAPNELLQGTFRRTCCFKPALQTALKLTSEPLTSDPSALRPLWPGGSLESYGLRSCTSEPLLANVKVTTACGHLMLEPAICYIPHHPSGHKVILVLRTKLGGSFDVVLRLRMPLRMDR